MCLQRFSLRGNFEFKPFIDNTLKHLKEKTMAAEEGGVPVDLYIYDLTHGLASLLSPAILGRQIEGVWHTSVVAFDREFFYGGSGVTSCAPGSTQLGAPHQVERLGNTFVPFQVFVDYMQGLATTTYTPAAYRLLEHNCNHFSDEVAQFLCGARVPKHIVAQPEQDLPPPLRGALTALLDQLVPAGDQTVYANGVRHSRQDSPDYLTLNNQIEEARLQSQELEQRRSTLAEKLARKERRREKKRKKHQRDHPDGQPADDLDDVYEAGRDYKYISAWRAWRGARAVGGPGSRCPAAVCSAPLDCRRLQRDSPLWRPLSSGNRPPTVFSLVSTEMAEGVETMEMPEAARAGPSSRALDIEPDSEPRRPPRDPPIVFRDLDGASEFEALSKALEKADLAAEEKQSLDELQQYLVHGEGSWVLGDEFLSFIGRLLTDQSLSGEVRRATLRCLAAAALRDDVSLILHQDRRHHALLGYAHSVDGLPPAEQHALALFMCNLFEHASSSEWLLYISEWEANGHQLSNIRVTTKVCVHCALSEEAELRDAGTALLYNVATKEVKTVVFDEVCVELAMAALQLLSTAPAEEHLWRTCSALARLSQHSNDVPQLVAVVGPDPSAYRGTSPRVDEQIDLIMQKVK
ncbi:unnamed protein product, partial [Iphiclides podalirius]